MAMEPINIFSRRIDPCGVVNLLRSLDPTVQVTGPDDVWQEATVSIELPTGHGQATLTFRHDPGYYDGDDWPRQMLGMQGYFARFPESDRKPEILQLIGTFRFALATDWEPDLDADGDERLAYLFGVTRHLDGVLFTPSSLRDAAGRILISADGEFEPDAVMPAMPRVEASVPEEDETAADEDEPEESAPPSPEQVARRALALGAVTARALLEQDDPSEAWVAEFHRAILTWVEVLGLTDELKPDEWKVLQRPHGTLDQRAQIDSTWRLEGLGVLAWALGRFDLPPYDQLVHPQALVRSLGVSYVEPGRALLAAPSLRPREELATFQERMFALHWRLRNYSLKPEAMDFGRFAREAWFGPLDITGVRLIDGDLALGEKAIAEAPEDVFQVAHSAARERHLAINWLHAGGIYSRTDTST